MQEQECKKETIKTPNTKETTMKTTTLKTKFGACAVSAVLAGTCAVAGITATPAHAVEQAELESSTASTTQSVNEMHRLYNPNSGEHFYTASTKEFKYLVSIGWKDEGIGWYAPTSSSTPVYRLYNPYSGDHHYTMSKSENDYLDSIGWTAEGIGWYSDDAKGVTLYRQFNPYCTGAGSHNYTTDKKENDYLATIGWNAEGTAWYGVKKTDSTPVENKSDDTTKSDSDSKDTGSKDTDDSSSSTHTHTWTPVYTTVHHDAVTKTVEEPVYETKTTSQVYCVKHNVPCMTNEERDADPDQLGWCTADKNCLANMTRKYFTEKVQTGTKTVTKVISEAYDEQVPTGTYTCTCGATK